MWTKLRHQSGVLCTGRHCCKCLAEIRPGEARWAGGKPGGTGVPGFRVKRKRTMIVKYANYIPHLYALDLIYERMGITKEDVVYLTLEHVCDLCRGEEHYILPLVSAHAFYHILIKYLIQNHLEDRFTFIPLSIGQTRTDYLTEDNLSKFRYIIDRFEMPIGCRDRDTA